MNTSNKTQPNNTAATESAPKFPTLVLLVLGAVFMSALLVRIFIGQKQTTATIGSRTYQLEIADTHAEQSKGLSGRDAINQNSGMLFVFKENDAHCFWMKDTKFALDMIWLNDQKKVTQLYENVTPSTYPQTFCSDDFGRYGVELPAGSVQQSGLQIGDSIDL